MILSAQSIRKRCEERTRYFQDLAVSYAILERPTEGLISPFSERAKAFGMTYGVGPCSYDIRVRETVRLEPGACQLISSLERFDMPVDLAGRIADKSTWARRFVVLQNTHIDPGWAGYLTMEVTNHSRVAVDLIAGMPIAQIIFEKLDVPTEQPYAGKYQSQAAEPVVAIDEVDA